MDDPDLADITIRSLAVGGDGVGPDAHGRIVFVAGALEGERVRGRIHTRKKRHAHAALVEVLQASPDRVVPECAFAREGCGGCGWAHVEPAAQRRAKVAMVSEALERLGGVTMPVDPGPLLDVRGFRTTVRMPVVGGRAGFHAHRSDAVVPVDRCLVAHPLIDDLLGGGRSFPGVDELVIRVGARTGERLVLADPRANELELPDDVLVVGVDELGSSARRAWIHERVAGVEFRISARSFFQARPDGAEALVDAVRAALGGTRPDGTIVDLYAGVGLFSATVGDGGPVVVVESSRSAVADARANLAHRPRNEVKVIGVPVERWRPSPAVAVVADPPRAGLGRVGVAKIAATGATRLALVSCDAGSLGRDVGLLVADGWRPEWARLVDLFPDTPHVEVVTAFTR